MKTKRILFLGALVSGLAFKTVSALSDEAIKEIPLGPRVLVLQQGPWLENMTVLDAGPSLVVVDTWSNPQATARAKAIPEVVKDPKLHQANLDLFLLE